VKSQLIRYFTCGPDEVRAWTIRKGTKAPQAAGVIQYANLLPFFYAFSFVYSSDFENKFVCGEIMTYEDLKEHGSEATVKAAGKLRQQGKPYESEFLLPPPFQTNANAKTVIDGDIAYWKSG
jgi:obg-like ATPase 1